ncbi:MAG: ABC-F family ATP-binding cassette domain-containing protein [Tuberibacillus sp.]
MSIVTVEQCTHGFGDKVIFRNIGFRLLAGEHIGLVGPNGAGKSTLLRILSRDILPDEGKVEWHSKVRVGYLEQHADLPAGKSIRSFLRDAFNTFYEKEKRLLELSQQLGDDSDPKFIKRLEEFGDIQLWLEQNGFYTLDAKIESVANGLGLGELGFDTDVAKLSGGQRTKLLLAKLLLQEPDVLLLDEPTNYLDVGHIEWLADFLQQYPNAFILISHDTDFMNQVVNVVYHLEHQRLMRYVGNYTSFLGQLEARQKQLLDQYARQQEEIKKLETYIAKNKARASTAKQAKSREKMLSRIDRIDKPSILAKPYFHFKSDSQPVRLVLEAEELVVGYEYPLFSTGHLTIERGEKVAVVGHNGVGKSTLLKTLLGELKPISGNVSIGDRVNPSYFVQETYLDDMTALEYIWSRFPQYTEKDVRKSLAQCGLKAEHILKSMSTLSGGEATKVRICELTLKKGNWLILDEPTNHLDVQAKAALKEALMRYDGTILIVTHEKAFMEGWVTKVWDVEKWVRHRMPRYGSKR